MIMMILKTKKRKVITVMTTIVLLFGVGCVSYAAGGNGWKNFVRSIANLLGADMRDPIPCWSAANHPDGCTGTFVDCGPCITVSGIPSGGQGQCTPGV